MMQENKEERTEVCREGMEGKKEGKCSEGKKEGRMMKEKKIG